MDFSIFGSFLPIDTFQKSAKFVHKGLFIDKDTSYNEGAFFSEISKMCLDAFYYFYVMYIKCLS